MPEKVLCWLHQSNPDWHVTWPESGCQSSASYVQPLDWVPTGANSYTDTDFAYPAANASAPNFGASFEDEEPLLQGELSSCMILY